jgi:hypothetical protein
LREKAPQGAGTEFELSLTVSHAEGHVARAGLDLEILEKAGQQRIVEFVIDDEARIDREGAIAPGNLHRASMPARPALGLEHSDIVRIAENIRTRKPRNSRSHNCYACHV